MGVYENQFKLTDQYLRNRAYIRYAWQGTELNNLKAVLNQLGQSIIGPEANVLPHEADTSAMKSYYTRRQTNANLIDELAKVNQLKTAFDTATDPQKKKQAEIAWRGAKKRYDDRMRTEWDATIGNNVSAVYPGPLKYEPFTIQVASIPPYGHIIKNSVTIVAGKSIAFTSDVDTVLSAVDFNNVTKGYRFFVNHNVNINTIANVFYNTAVPI